MFNKERAAAKEFNNNLEHLEERVFSWGTRKYRLDKVFNKNHGSYMERFEGFPESYEGMMIASWIFSRVILDRELLMKFSRNEKESLFPVHNGYLKHWKENKPLWSLFDIVDRKDEDVFEVEDALTGEIMLVQSRGMASMAGDRPIISVLLPLKEGIWITYGIMHQYKGAYSRHLLDLIRFMDYGLYEKGDLTSFINQYYARFFQIDQTMETPITINKKELIERCWLEIILPEFDPESLSEDFLIEESEGIYRLKSKSNEPFPFSEIHFNRETEEAYFSSMTLKGYRELCAMVSDYELPEEPDYAFSMPLYLAMDQYMDFSFPHEAWEAYFPEKESSPEMDEVIGKINVLLKEVLDAQNNGDEFDLYKRGEELGLAPENIKSVEEIIGRMPGNDF